MKLVEGPYSCVDTLSEAGPTAASGVDHSPTDTVCSAHHEAGTQLLGSTYCIQQPYLLGSGFHGGDYICVDVFSGRGHVCFSSYSNL